MLFVLSQYWPFLLAALLAGLFFGLWLGSPAGRRRRLRQTLEPKT